MPVSSSSSSAPKLPESTAVELDNLRRSSLEAQQGGYTAAGLGRTLRAHSLDNSKAVPTTTTSVVTKVVSMNDFLSDVVRPLFGHTDHEPNANEDAAGSFVAPNVNKEIRTSTLKQACCAASSLICARNRHTPTGPFAFCRSTC